MRRFNALALPLWVLATLVAFLPEYAFAQRQYDVWYFGYGRGLDFSTAPPQLLTNGKTQTIEGSAVWCDPKSGELLFYTDGMMVWDRLHRLMPNGTNLIGDQSSTQSSLIVPDPADPKNRYYLFHLDQSGYIKPSRGLHYSVIDLRLNGGYGDVTGQKNIELMQSSTEKITAIPKCDGEAYWIVTHEMYNNTFVVWHLGANGLFSIPVRSSIGEVHGPLTASGAGYLAASPDGNMLISCKSMPEETELFKFDATTGKVSNRIRLPFIPFSYGASFSPDNSKVYVCGEGEVSQFDLSVWDQQTIVNSRHRMRNNDARVGAIKAGPDKKLYVQHGSVIGVISNPNMAGALCDYKPDAISLGGIFGMYGLPNNIDAVESHDCKRPIARIMQHKNDLCEGTCMSFRDSSLNAPTNFLWTFEGATPTSSTERDPKNVCYETAGTYNVKLVVWNQYGSDSATSKVRVKSCPIPEITLRDTTVCISTCLTFKDTSSVSTKTTWEFDYGTPESYLGKTPPPICYYRPGKHRVRAISSNQYGADTAIAYVTVESCDDPIAKFTHDTVICVSESLALTDRSQNKPTSWEWTIDGGSPSTSSLQNPKDITFESVGVYAIRLIVTNPNGSDTAYSSVRVAACDPPVATLQSYEICEGDSVYLEDLSTNDPIAWEWQLEGITPGYLTTKRPGMIRYNDPGRFSIQLISRNLYGADTAFATVLVRSARGPVAPPLVVGTKVSACEAFDTSFVIYAGCADNQYGSFTSDDPAVTVLSSAGVLKSQDSARILVRILTDKLGERTATITFKQHDDLVQVPISYGVASGKENFALSQLNTEFSTTHCDAITRELRITNKSCTGQGIKRVYLRSKSGTSPFSIAFNDAGLDLQAEQALRLEITYDPTRPGDVDPELVIETAKGNAHVCSLKGVRAPLPEMRFEIRNASHSATSGDMVQAEIVSSNDVSEAILPNTVDLLLSYNTDLLSIEQITPAAGWEYVSHQEINGQLSLKLAMPQAIAVRSDDPVASLSFKTYLAKEDSTALTLAKVTGNGGDAQFASCVLATTVAGTGSVSVGAECGADQLRGTLGKERAVNVLVQPNPVSIQERAIRLTVTSVIDVGTTTFELIDLHGKRVFVDAKNITAGRHEFSVTLPNVPAGVYTFSASTNSEIVTNRLVIY
jgi:PKD repeat protein